MMINLLTLFLRKYSFFITGVSRKKFSIWKTLRII